MRIALVALLAGCDGVFGLIELHHDTADSTPDLVAQYSLDEAQPPFADASGGGHLGTCVDPRCPSAVVGHIAGAAHFDGIDDRIDIAGAAEFDGSDAFTVSLWIIADQVPTLGTSGCPVSKMFGLSNRNSWQVCHASTGLLVFWSSQQDLDPVASPAPISLAAWHHVAFRWDGTTKILSLDGIDVANRVTTVIEFDAGPIFIGSDVDNGQPRAPFRGAIDDVRIYNRALSSAEITMLAQQ